MAGHPLKAMEILSNILAGALIVMAIYIVADFIATPEEYW